VDGVPFLSSTIDGVPWSPDSDDFSAYVEGSTVILTARRNPETASTTEQLLIVFTTSNAFRLSSYALRGDSTGGGQFAIHTHNPEELAEWYVTHAEHTGSVTITGANSGDSVVSGLVAFEGEDRTTHDVRHLRGQFRVQYTSIEH
jgi:hypothetical protein